jgi:acyl carrier protein
VPSHFLFLDAMPLTDNGKVDRRALPAPDGLRPNLATPFREPASTAERYIAGLWSRLLGVDPVGADDNFFDLGGHSLLATQVMALAREERGIELSLRGILERPTVREIARMLESTEDPEAITATPSSAAEREVFEF